ncbi:MAG: membrane protein [Cyanobium sp. CACIAM 14]|nr:MAG: membrane protein [Cyanobium sp. CACIAM 14]
MVSLPPQDLHHWLAALGINGLLIALAQRVPLLTPQGWVHAGILGTLLWGSLGWRGWLAVVAYLALGSLVTKLGFRHKHDRGLAESRGGRRGPENVWGSALVGTLLALLATRAAAGAVPLLLAAFAASFAAKLGDTFGSEIGKRWGRHTVLIISLRPVPPGTEGAISLEGTAASLLGSALMSLVMLALGLIRGWPLAALVSGVGLLATLAESVVGATLQRRWPWLSNELVNGLQTLLAALLTLGLLQGGVVPWLRTPMI